MSNDKDERLMNKSKDVDTSNREMISMEEVKIACLLAKKHHESQRHVTMSDTPMSKTLMGNKLISNTHRTSNF